MYTVYPPLKEQRAIVSYLGRKLAEVNEFITKKKRLIECLKEQKTSIVNKAITRGTNPDVHMKDTGIYWLREVPSEWTVKKFAHCTKIRSGQVDPKLEPYRDMTLIAPNHIESGTGTLLYTETAKEQGAESGKYLYKDNEVIYSKIRPHLKKVCLASGNGICSADMYPIKPIAELLPEFLVYFMLCEKFSAYTVDMSMRVAMPKINREDLTKSFVAYPNCALQKKIVSYIQSESKKIDDVINKTQHEIDIILEFRNTLISDVVTGKVCVSNASDRKIQTGTTLKSNKPLVTISTANNLSASMKAMQAAMKPALQMREAMERALRPAMQMQEAMQEALEPFRKQQEFISRQMKEIVRPSKIMCDYLAEIAAQNQRIFNESFAGIKLEASINASWANAIEEVNFKTQISDALSQIYKSNLQTEKLFLQFKNLNTFKSSVISDIQKNTFKGFLSDYSLLSKSIQKWDGIFELPRFALVDASRENFLSNLSIGYIRPSEAKLDESDIDYIESEIEVVSSDIIILKQLHPDIAKVIEAAGQALKGSNSDKARHVLASLREGFNHLLHRLSPDENVLEWINDENKPADFLYDGRPTRRARFLYICREVNFEPLEKFFEKDIQATLELINVFQRMHDITPNLTDAQLRIIVAKTESAILFILRLIQ